MGAACIWGAKDTTPIIWVQPVYRILPVYVGAVCTWSAKDTAACIWGAKDTTPIRGCSLCMGC